MWSPMAIVGSETDADGNHIELGNENPDYRISYRNSLKMGDFELSFLIDHKEGGHAINLANLIYDLGGTTGDYDKEELDLDGDGTKSGNGNERLTVLGGVTAHILNQLPIPLCVILACPIHCLVQSQTGLVLAI